MPENIDIIRNSRKSVDSVDVERELSFDIQHTTSPLSNGNVKGTVDLTQRYLYERNSCDNYRLILTINPYCTNVLFNTCTEVVKAEGSDVTDAVIGDDKVDSNTLKQIKNKIKGKNHDIDIYDMIRDTEYSKDEIGFEYHPGLDIFNNHILRNKTYRIVNDYEKLDDVSIFNTISDTMRTANGKEMTRCCRRTILDKDFIKKHLYDKDDILPFYTGEAIEENLREENGWFGFYNTSVIAAKSRSGVDMDISRVINSKGNCEFIDMYPDRTLFSFTPKYNPYRNRLEYNWDYVLTYPFDSTTTYTFEDSEHELKEYDIELVQDNGVNALALVTVKMMVLPNGNNAIFFRSATKHNLNPQDKVYIYFNGEEENGNWQKSRNTYLVSGVGDIDHNYEEYYFYITDMDLLEEIFCTPYLCDNNIDNDFIEYDDTQILENDDVYYLFEGGEYAKYIVSGLSDGVTVQQFKQDNGYTNIYRETTPWDYVRDYFYDVYSPDQIANYDVKKTYIVGQLTKRNNIVYITVNQCSGLWDQNNFKEFTDDYFVAYPDNGLTNVPSEFDKYIMVDGVKYILCNHDRDMIYDGSVDINAFIRGIVNNAFTNNDEYGSNDDVNPSMNGLWSDYVSVRFVKTNGNYDCSYYVRKFKPIPGMDGGSLNRETYPLAFADTIYGDSISQSVFTDNVNVSGLTDNLGRNVTEVFLTVVKTNRGYKKWYGISDEQSDANIFNDEDIEYSHCFGPVTCGFDIFSQIDDTVNIRDIRRDYIDVTMININDNISTIPTSEVDTTDITVDDEWFYGDVVEFCPWTCSETVISDVCFRFNTAQRELADNTPFKFDEIDTDDYDINGFKVYTYKVLNGVHRPEGYYYKAHYRIPLRDLTPVIQDSHQYISVYEAQPVQLDDIYILVKTSLKHNITNGMKVLLRDTVAADTPEWWLNVVSIVDDYIFIMEKISKDDDEYRDWVAICKNLNNNNYTLRAQNLKIPESAARLGVNTYLWREVANIWDISNGDSETNNYVFANNALYVDKTFNFYLRRQDPYNVNGLYFDGSQCTITCSDEDNETCDGSMNMDAIDKWFIGDRASKADTTESNYEYKDEHEAQC